jgi:hypothetical protein
VEPKPATDATFYAFCLLDAFVTFDARDNDEVLDAAEAAVPQALFTTREAACAAAEAAVDARVNGSCFTGNAPIVHEAWHHSATRSTRNTVVETEDPGWWSLRVVVAALKLNA